MTYSVFIDHPDGLGDYEYLSGEHTGEDIVSRKVGIRVKFVCNSAASISKGDIYEVPFELPEDVTAFVLKNTYPLIDPILITQYRRSRNR